VLVGVFRNWKVKLLQNLSIAIDVKGCMLNELDSHNQHYYEAVGRMSVDAYP
jgi:hypothetical protein